jgi:flavin-binding protein dodecin
LVAAASGSIIGSEAGAFASRFHQGREKTMAKKKSGGGVYRVTEIIGTSTTSWEDAAKSAVEIAGKSLRDLRIAEIVKLDMRVEDGKVVAYRARVSLSFKYEA